MATIVVTTFELADGVTAEAFAEADARYQQDVAYQQPGLLRRTTAVDAETPGVWCVFETWGPVGRAVAWHTGDLAALVSKAERRVYETLD